MPPESHTLLQNCRDALNRGDSDPAATLARSRQTKDLHDPALHLAWADLLEELGLMEEVILELNLAIRDDPERPETYQRLADIYLDQGQPLKAAHLFGHLVKRRPRDPAAYQSLGQALEEAQAYDKARLVYQAGLEKTGDSRFQALVQQLSFLEAAGPAAAPAPPPESGQLSPQQHHLVAFTTLFAGREGVHARQWVSPTGETGYTPVQEPFTLKVAENHLLGNYTIGIYPLRMDNTVTFIAFDFDLAKFAVHKAITNQRAWEAMMAKVHQAACRLLDAAAAQDLPMYLEDSGFKGRHAWIFLETPVPAGVAKKCGDLLAARLQPLPPEVTVEVFPKQGSIKPGGLGNLIKLPLGFHKRTGQRAWFIEPNGAPYPDQLQFLLSVSRASRRQVYAFIQRSQVQLQGAAAAGAQPATAAPASEAPAPWEPETAPEAAPPLPPAAAPYNLDTDPQFQHLVFKCPVLRAINEKIHQTSLLSKDETMVLIHTLGHLERGPQAVNELFQRCLNADPSLFLKSRLRGNPMSCPKIRARLPELTSTLACNCTFDLTVNLYPTPVIHLHGLSAAAPATPLGLTVESLQFQNLLKEYLKLRQQLRETQLLLGRYEERLSGFFSEAGVEEVQTAAGKLRRQLDQDGKAAFILEL